ncbi:hypothetical protein C0J52_01967 [Blattella germanica]|nr:hypothetical protein C0J52_01967 [Blattella germanica]
MTRKSSVQNDTADYKFICNQNGLLMAAIDSGSIELVDKLLKESEDLKLEVVNSPCGRMKITPLQLAAAKGKHAGPLVKLLLANGARADTSDKLGRTPLHNAALVGNEEAVEALLKAGANVESCVQVNSWPKHNTYLNTLELDCNEFSAEFKLPMPECWGRTPLHQAAKGGNPNCVYLLLRANAKVNVQDEKEVVALLVEANADVNVYSEVTGMTPMHFAASLGSMSAMKCLLDAGAVPVEMKENGISTVLHEAAKIGSLPMVELLLENGAEKLVNSKDKNGYTPLHKAAYAGARDCLAILLMHGGDLAAESPQGVSVMDTIFSHVPRPISFFNDIFDRSIITNDFDVNSRDFKVTLDFSILCPYGFERQMAVVSALMEGGSDFQQKQIARHPLFETFLRFKWHRLRVFFYMLMSVHFLQAISLSTFCALRVGPGDSVKLDMAHKFLMGTVCVLAIHFIIQILMLPRHYIAQYETWVNFTSILLSFTIAVAHLTGRMEFLDKSGKVTGDSWILHLMSVAVLLVWIEFMLLIGRIPKLGYYALMFYQTIVMMMGEYEYNDLFNEDNDDNKTTKLRLMGTSRVIFFAFIVLSSIVLMNLMVGLAVSDIQDLYTNKSREYGSALDESLQSPDSSIDTITIMTMLHQLQTELAEIKQSLNNNHTNTARDDHNINEEQHRIQPVRTSRWRRPVTDVQEAQSILRILRRTNSNTRNAVV